MLCRNHVQKVDKAHGYFFDWECGLCINAFPESDGISERVSPANIVQGKQKPNMAHKI